MSTRLEFTAERLTECERWGAREYVSLEGFVSDGMKVVAAVFSAFFLQFPVLGVIVWWEHWQRIELTTEFKISLLGLSMLAMLIVAGWRMRKRRQARRCQVAVDEEGVRVGSSTYPWSSIENILDDVVVWRMDGGDAGGHSVHAAPSVILERVEGGLAFVVADAQRAERLAVEMNAIRTSAPQATGKQEEHLHREVQRRAARLMPNSNAHAPESTARSP